MDDADRDGGKPAAGLSPGELVAGYVVGERLGVGGFGEVYAAKHAVIGKEVAIKILHRRYSHDADAVARFVAEAQAVNRIQHAGIVDIFDFGRLPDGREFCVMERIRGRTLRQLLAERGRLPVAEAVPVLRAVAEAIDAAHGAGVAHRDLKPDNVFVVDDAGGPLVKLIDFGLAKLTDAGAAEAATVTRTGAMAGTPLYMSPEQCRGRNVDARTDLYSFGALAYHVLTGSPPFAGDALELALHHINDPPDAPSSRCNDLSPAVDRAVLALLDKDPALRPTPLAIAVEAMASGAQLRTRRPLRWIAAIGGAAIIVVGGGVAQKSCVPDRTVAADAGQLAAPRFVERHVPVVQDNMFLWPTLSPDGETVVYFDRGWRALRVADSHRASIDPPPGCMLSGLVSPMAHDGVLAVPWGANGTPGGAPCPDPTGPWIWMRGADRTWRALTVAGSEPNASPDGKRIEVNRGGMIVVHDLETGHEAEIASAASVEAGIRWSPDGDQLVWARRDQAGLARLEIASISAPSVRSIPAALLDPATLITGRQTAGSSGPAAFRDSDHLIYCASDAAGPRVEERTLGTGQVVTLRGLDVDVIGCAVSASSDGRVMIVAYRNVGGGSVLAVDDPSAEWHATVGDRFDVPVEVTPDGRLLIAKPRSDDRQPIELVTTALDGSQPARVAGCEGSTDVVRWGSQLRLVDVRTEGLDDVFRLRSLGECATIAEWRLPALSGWGRLHCGARFCVVARQEGSTSYVWQLGSEQPRGSELVRSDLPSNVFGSSPVDLAISRDGKSVVMVGRDRSIRVISVDGKPTDQGAPVRELDLGPWYFQHVVWSNDDRHFYASACCPTTVDESARGRGVRVIRADLDGHSENLSDHDKDFTYTRIAITALSPDGKTLLGFTTRVEPDVMLLDFER